MFCIFTLRYMNSDKVGKSEGGEFVGENAAEVDKGFAQEGDFEFDGIENIVFVYLEIAVGDMVSHTLKRSPVNIGAMGLTEIRKKFVNAFDALADGLDKHAVCGEFLDTPGSRQKIVGARDYLVPLAEMVAGRNHLLEAVECGGFRVI